MKKAKYKKYLSTVDYPSSKKNSDERCIAAYLGKENIHRKEKLETKKWFHTRDGWERCKTQMECEEVSRDDEAVTFL